MLEYNPPTIDNKPDPGDAAREKLRGRMKLARLRKRIVRLFMFLVIAFFAMCYFMFETRVETTETYTRECSLPKESPIQVTAKRIYRNDVIKIAGILIKSENSTEERTLLNVPNEELLVVTLGDEKWTSNFYPEGETKIVDLYDAHAYVFTQGKSSWVVLYKDFCGRTQ